MPELGGGGGGGAVAGTGYEHERLWDGEIGDPEANKRRGSKRRGPSPVGGCWQYQLIFGPGCKEVACDVARLSCSGKDQSLTREDFKTEWEEWKERHLVIIHSCKGRTGHWKGSRLQAVLWGFRFGFFFKTEKDKSIFFPLMGTIQQRGWMGSGFPLRQQGPLLVMEAAAAPARPNLLQESLEVT